MALVQTSSPLRTEQALGTLSLPGVAAGNALFVVCSNFGSGFTSVTGSVNGAFTKAVGIIDNGNNAVEVWYRLNASAGSETISFAVTSATGDTYISAAAMEWSGVATTGALDRTGTGTDSLTATASAANTQADALVIHGTVCDTGASIGYGTPGGYTLLDRENDSITYTGYQSAYKVVAATETSTGTATAGIAGSNFDSVIATFKLSAGSPDVTVALTGVEATGAAGSVTASTDSALTGNAGTGGVGNVAASISAALTGQAGTGAAGNIAASAAIALSNVVGTGAAGTVAADTSAALTGTQGDGAVGDVVASNPGASDVTVALTGVEGTGQVGSLAVDTSAALAGVAGAGAVGTITAAIASPDVTIALTGVQGVGQVGNVTASGGDAPAGGSMGFEMGGGRVIPEVSRKPLLQRILDARNARRVKPAKPRAAKRARYIEIQAAELALEQGNGEQFDAFMRDWLQTRPVLPPEAAADPTPYFLAQVAFRLEQMQAEDRARQALRALEEEDEEEAIALLLL